MVGINNKVHEITQQQTAGSEKYFLGGGTKC